MRITPTPLPGLLRIAPQPKQDERGFLMEVYRQDVLAAAGLRGAFVQENHSHSRRHVLRGLHFQWDPPLGKLIRVIRGSAFVVAADIRPSSPTLGQWQGFSLREDNWLQIYAAPGFAIGFCVTGEVAEVEYHYTAFHNSRGEGSIRWNDPQLAITWPTVRPILSPRDRIATSFAAWLARPESARW